MTTPITPLWPMVLADFSDPKVFWQIGTITLCIAFAWFLARLLRGRIATRDSQMRVVRFGVESFSRVLWPLLALALIAIAKPLLGAWQSVSLLRIAIPLVGAFALIRLLMYVLRRVFARSGRVGSFLQLFEKLISLVVWAGIAVYILGLWPNLVEFLDNTMIPIGRNKTSLLTIAGAVVSVGVTLVLAMWGAALMEERLMHLDTMHSSLRVVLARLGRATLIMLAVLLSLSLVGIDLTVLSVFGGALGVGLGLGLQKIVSSYFSGFVILIERSLAIGDLVTVDKYTGRVMKINTRTTILRSADGTETVIPNEMLVSAPVQNSSLADKKVRLTTNVTVGHDVDLPPVLALLEAAALRQPRVLAEPVPTAGLLRFAPDGLELELGFSINDPENGRTNLITEVNGAIWQDFQQHGINIPTSPREFRLVRSDGESSDGEFTKGFPVPEKP